MFRFWQWYDSVNNNDLLRAYMEATTQPLITDLHQFSTDMLASEINPSQAAAQQATDDGDNVQANCNSLSYQHPES